MDDITKKAWELYSQNLTKQELDNKQLCKRLRETYGFVMLRLSIALNNIFIEILKVFKGCWSWII